MSALLMLLLSLDVMGTTPIYKSGLHDEGSLRMEAAPKRCKGLGWCVEVCPRNCLDLQKRGRGVVSMPGPERCVRCAACIIHCPCAALCFRGREGMEIDPHRSRRYKLNLPGRRAAGGPG